MYFLSSTPDQRHRHRTNRARLQLHQLGHTIYHHHHRRPSGFTLLELLTASCIIAVLSVGTMTTFAPVFDRMRIISLVADFHSALSRARHEAVRRGRRVDLLPLVVGDWRYGWCVAIDTNNNQHADAGELMLHRGVTALPAGVEITARLTDSKRTYLAFDPSGRPRTVASASVPQYGSVLFQLGQQKRKLIIGFLGRVRVCDPDRDGSTC